MVPRYSPQASIRCKRRASGRGHWPSASGRETVRCFSGSMENCPLQGMNLRFQQIQYVLQKSKSGSSIVGWRVPKCLPFLRRRQWWRHEAPPKTWASGLCALPGITLQCSGLTVSITTCNTLISTCNEGAVMWGNDELSWIKDVSDLVFPILAYYMI